MAHPTQLSWIILRVSSTKTLKAADTLAGVGRAFYVPVRAKAQHLNGYGAKKQADRKKVYYPAIPQYIFARIEPNHPALKYLEKRGMVYGYLHSEEGEAVVIPQRQMDNMREQARYKGYRGYDPDRHKEKPDAGDGPRKHMKAGYEFDMGDYVTLERGVTPSPLKVMSFEKQDSHAKISFMAFGKEMFSTLPVEDLILWEGEIPAQDVA